MLNFSIAAMSSFTIKVVANILDIPSIQFDFFKRTVLLMMKLPTTFTFAYFAQWIETKIQVSKVKTRER